MSFRDRIKAAFGSGGERGFRVVTLGSPTLDGLGRWSCLASRLNG